MTINLSPAVAEKMRLEYHAKQAATQQERKEWEQKQQTQRADRELYWKLKRAELHQGVTEKTESCCDCDATIPQGAVADYHTEPLNTSNRGWNLKWTKLWSCHACAARRMEATKQ